VTLTPAAVELIGHAAAHLHRAAAAARHRGGDDSFSDWHAYAGQLELAAVGLNPDRPSDLAADGRAIGDHIRDAGAALESIPPLQGPPDLVMWVWHLSELRRLADDMDQ
jgi:hypothetical protein